MAVTDILAVQEWEDNGALILDVARLGYLHTEWLTLDATHGMGTWWKRWRPVRLVRNDINPDNIDVESHHDFRSLPWPDRHFDAIAFDPPYKLNGTPGAPDLRYGVHVATPWRDRMALIEAGITECARLLGGGYLLVKCQDQVCSGQVRWQSYEFVGVAAAKGLRLIDRFDFISHRAQPPGRRQLHARRNASQLLVFSRP